MIYNAIGLMSGSSLDGVDLAFCELIEAGGQWQYKIHCTHCYHYDNYLQTQLTNCTQLNLEDYLKLDVELGIYFAKCINDFIEQHQLHHKVHLIASHGHTTLHRPQLGYSAQIGCGATMSAHTGLPVINQLRSVDVALGGQGAPIVPIAEKLLFGNYTVLLNIGGIANISVHTPDNVIAFDVCAANRVLNALAQEVGQAYDKDGAIAQRGQVQQQLLQQLNQHEYFSKAAPKSLANEFGINHILPIIASTQYSIEDKMSTMVEHIAMQIAAACEQQKLQNVQMLATGGGALNKFLISRMQHHLNRLDVNVIVPDEQTVQYKEALAMALIGVLRWREEINVLHTVTGAKQSSVGGALWITHN